jgi:hypothetical protein
MDFFMTCLLHITSLSINHIKKSTDCTYSKYWGQYQETAQRFASGVRKFFYSQSTPADAESAGLAVHTNNLPVLGSLPTKLVSIAKSGDQSLFEAFYAPTALFQVSSVSGERIP